MIRGGTNKKKLSQKNYAKLPNLFFRFPGYKSRKKGRLTPEGFEPPTFGSGIRRAAIAPWSHEDEPDAAPGTPAGKEMSLAGPTATQRRAPVAQLDSASDF